MLEKKGFTLIELLIVVAVIAILAALSIQVYSFYIRDVVLKNVIINDLRICFEEVLAKTSIYGISPQDALADCPKSKYTQAYYLVSTNPLRLKAVARYADNEIVCNYDSGTGDIYCEAGE